MSEYNSRSYLRDSHGPRVIESGFGREKCRSGRHEHSKSKKGGHEKKKSKSEPSPKQQKQTKSPSMIRERPSFRLDICNPPPKAISLGLETSVSVLVSLHFSCSENVPSMIDVDLSRLVTVASLVAETRNGDRVAMEAGSMTADQPVSSVHHASFELSEKRRQTRPNELLVGYCNFSGLLIRQSGHFRIRLTLLQLPGPGSCLSSPTSILSADSDLIKVERRRIGQSAAPRSRQRS